MGMVTMVHMNVYGPGRDPQRALELLARQACFDPDEQPVIPGEAGGSEDPYAPVLAQTLGLLHDLGQDAACPAWAHGQEFDLDEVAARVEGFAAEVAKRGQLKTELAARLNTYQQAKAQLYHLTGLQTSVDEIFACKYLKVRFGRLPKDSYDKLSYYDGQPFTFREYDFDGQYYWGIYFVPESAAEEVDKIFASLYFERMWVPDFVHGTPQDAIAQIMAQESELQARQKAADDLGDIAGPGDVQWLRDAAAWLSYRSQIARMYRYVVLLDSSFYISGFVPQSQVQPLKLAAAKELPELRLASDEEVGAKGGQTLRPPTKLKNNWFAKPFEMFIDMYGMPEYGDIDPTGFVAVTYSVLFGIMFGDVGQGILLGLVGYFIMYKKLHMAIGRVLTRCSVFCTLFGFVYGSVFGFEHALDGFYHALGFAQKPLEVLEPTAITELLVSSVAAGVFLILCAMTAGILSHLKRGQPLKAVFSVNGVAGAVFYFSVVLLVVKLVTGLPIPFVGTAPFYVLCIAVPLAGIYFAEPICKKLAGEPLEEGVGEVLMNGFFEVFDALLSFASNTMSFLRVGGFALAHAGMMTMVFTLADMMPNVLLYILIVVVGNVFVMGLEGLFVGIQVLRLEFYEMFSRFFDADGRPFTPLAVRAPEAA